MEPRLAFTVFGLLTAGALLMMLSHRNTFRRPGNRRGDWAKYAVFCILILGLLATAGWGGRWAVFAWVVLIAAAGSNELANVLARPRKSAVRTGSFLTLLVLLSHLLWANAGFWYPGFVFTLLVVAAVDSFSQLWGRLLGRHKLCPQISPNKTIEGLIGGTITAILTAILLGFLFPEVSRSRLTVLGFLTVAGAVSGDLLFSLIKRSAGAKDFSRLLPGQGGVLDRFDSLVVAAPVFAWSRLALLG